MNHVITLPQMFIETDNKALAAEHLASLVEVRVQQRLSLPTLCELTFADPPASLANAAWLVPGTALHVKIVGQREALFVGQVTAVEHCYEAERGYELRVRGYDLLHQLRKRQSVRAHIQVTTQELAQELVAGLGLTVQATESGPLWSHLIQHRQSDLELLQDIAERCGLYLAVRGSILHLLTLQGMGEALPLTFGATLLEARIEVNADSACRSVEAAGWNPSRVEAHAGRTTQARVGRVVAAEVTPSRVGASDLRTIVDEGAPNDEHALAIAQAELDRHVAQEITFWGIAEGDPRLRPGSVVRISGVAEAVAGCYVLSAVTHSIDARRGFLSELSSMPPPPSARARGSIATPGVVTQIDDPEKLGRVRVTLPTYGNVETDWMGVISAAAGAGKGFMALPDIGDTVLVLLAHEDPGQGVVLGSLYGVQEPPDVGIAGGVVSRYTLLTPGGQRIRLDDAKQTIRLENSGGSYYELSPDKVRVHAAVDLEIEAPGQRVVIRGQNIDFERG